MSIASLPMYDLAPLQAANDRYWQAIRTHLGDGPEELVRGGDLWAQWQSPDLILSQTCGYPYRARLHDKVGLIGTPDYGLPGCPPGHYNSVFVARRDDPRAGLSDFDGARLAYNEAMSQSGWAAPIVHSRAWGVAFCDHIPTGGHLFSARAVAEGRADIAGIDALTWALLCAHEDCAAQLKEIGRTAPTPVLPYITAKGRDTGPLFSAIEAAIADLSAADRALLHLKGIVRIEPAAYLSVPTPPGPDEL